MKFNGIADVHIIEHPAEIKRVNSLAGKAFLRVKFESGETVDMSLTLAEMIGGVAAGAQKRFGYV